MPQRPGRQRTVNPWFVETRQGTVEEYEATRQAAARVSTRDITVELAPVDDNNTYAGVFVHEGTPIVLGSDYAAEHHFTGNTRTPLKNGYVAFIITVMQEHGTSELCDIRDRILTEGLGSAALGDVAEPSAATETESDSSED